MLNFIPVVSTTVYINPTVQLPSFYIHFSLFPPLSLPLLLYFSYQLYSLYPSRYYPLVRTLFFLLLQLFLSNSSHSTAYYLSPASFSITFILSSSQSFFLTHIRNTLSLTHAHPRKCTHSIFPVYLSTCFEFRAVLFLPWPLLPHFNILFSSSSSSSSRSVDDVVGTGSSSVGTDAGPTSRTRSASPTPTPRRSHPDLRNRIDGRLNF